MEFIKFDRTAHLEGSRLQDGDEDLEQVPIKKVHGRWIVIEEKFDGGNSGVSFPNAELKTQSRGHYLEGGDHTHFNLFKQWAACHEEKLFDRLGDQFIMFGEWMLAKHSVYYNQLPHYFLEFDLWDRSRDCWLDTPSRKQIIGDAPVLPVKILYEGECPKDIRELIEEIQPSVAKTPDWINDLMLSSERAYNGRKDYAWEKILKETEMSHLSEGLYIKIEEDGKTVNRLKYVRHDFVQAIKNSETHWKKRPVIQNFLAPNVDIFSPTLTHTWEDLWKWPKNNKDFDFKI